MAEIAKSHGGGEFIHLAVSAYRSHFLLAEDSEVFKLIKLGHELLVLLSGRYGTALNGIKHLGSMKRKHGSVPEGTDSLSFILLTKGVGSIIKNLEVMLICDFLYLFHVADITVNMHGNYSSGFFGYKGLQLICIYGIVL